MFVEVDLEICFEALGSKKTILSNFEQFGRVKILDTEAWELTHAPARTVEAPEQDASLH